MTADASTDGRPSGGERRLTPWLGNGGGRLAGLVHGTNEHGMPERSFPSEAAWRQGCFAPCARVGHPRVAPNVSVANENETPDGQLPPGDESDTARRL